MNRVQTALKALIATGILSATSIAQDDPNYVQPDTSKEDPKVTEQLNDEVKNQGTRGTR